MLSVRLRQMLTARPLLVCALATGLMFWLAGLAPFWFSLSAHEVKAAVKSAQWIPLVSHATERTRSAKPLNWSAELLSWTLAGGLLRAGLAGIAEKGSRHDDRLDGGGVGSLEPYNRNLPARGSRAMSI